ncbi:MAG TPA: hypothetical protein VJ417_16125, partial [Candidatus Glassbacteria bacterium]|nr:hypothetical protein [Candidatus Glassbacteria bacterium]
IVSGLSPGSYWLMTTEPLIADGRRYYWSSPFHLNDAETPVEVVFQRSNAALVLNPGKYAFRGN